MGESQDAGVSGLQYLGPDPQMPGGHMVQTPDGVITLPAEGLTPALQAQAITYDSEGGFQGGQTAPPPQQDPNTSASPRQMQALQGSTTPYDPAAQTALTPDQQKSLGSQGVALNPGQIQPPASNAGTAAAVPIPAAVGFQPPAQAQGAPAPAAAPQTRTGGGGGPPAGTKQAAEVFGQQGTQEAAAAKAKYEADSGLASEQAQIGQQNSQNQSAQLAQRQAMEAQTAQQVQDLLQRSKQVADQFANAKVDPQSYWKNMSTQDHITAAASMILSGLGSGLAGQQNLAVKHFDDAVNNDIAAQRFNIEHGKDVSEQYSKLAQDYQAAGLSRRQALDATDLAIKNKAVTDQANAAFGFGGDQAKAAFLKETAPIQAKVLTDTQDFVKGVAATKLTQAQTANQYAEAAQKRAEAAQIPLKYQQGQWANQVGGPGGLVGQAASPEVAKAYNDEVKPAQDISSVLDQIDEARKAGVVPNQADLQVLAGRLRQSVGGLGDIKESARTEEIINQMTGDPTQFFSVLPGSKWSGREKALRDLSGSLQRNAIARHRIAVLKPDRSMIKETPAGG